MSAPLSPDRYSCLQWQVSHGERVLRNNFAVARPPQSKCIVTSGRCGISRSMHHATACPIFVVCEWAHPSYEVLALLHDPTICGSAYNLSLLCLGRFAMATARTPEAIIADHLRRWDWVLRNDRYNILRRSSHVASQLVVQAAWPRLDLVWCCSAASESW